MNEKNKTDYLNLLMLRKSIIEFYYQVYNDYEVIESANLEEKEDITLDFVNCTICLAKNNISKNKLGTNYVMQQPCLRNNHLDLLSNYKEESNYMSYFTMIGGYHYITEQENWINEFNKITQRQFDFFKGIEKNADIYLTIPIQYSKCLPLSCETIKKICDGNGKILYSKNDENNLKRKYGIDGIIGYGTRWELRNIRGSFVNCGNDIILFNCNNNAIGIDFGSGLETLVSIKNGEKNLLYSNIICSDYINGFCCNDKLNEKLIDSLVSIIFCNYYKENKNFRVKYLIFIYMRIISAISIFNDINEEKLIKLMQEICKNINIKADNIIMETINKVIEQKSFIYSLAISNRGQTVVSQYINKNSKYEKKLLDIEIHALKKIIEMENHYVKTEKIKQRG